MHCQSWLYYYRFAVHRLTKAVVDKNHKRFVGNTFKCSREGYTFIRGNYEIWGFYATESLEISVSHIADAYGGGEFRVSEIVIQRVRVEDTHLYPQGVSDNTILADGCFQPVRTLERFHFAIHEINISQRHMRISAQEPSFWNFLDEANGLALIFFVKLSDVKLGLSQTERTQRETRFVSIELV